MEEIKNLPKEVEDITPKYAESIEFFVYLDVFQCVVQKVLSVCYVNPLKNEDVSGASGMNLSGDSRL